VVIYNGESTLGDGQKGSLIFRVRVGVSTCAYIIIFIVSLELANPQ
jgi:hypothetical protein